MQTTLNNTGSALCGHWTISVQPSLNEHKATLKLHKHHIWVNVMEVSESLQSILLFYLTAAESTVCVLAG